MSKVWVVSLQDGEDPTYVILDELPIVSLVDEEALNDPMFKLPSNCVDTDHIHIKYLLENSHWNDHSPVLPYNPNLGVSDEWTEAEKREAFGK